jgi:hypothetical protein
MKNALSFLWLGGIAVIALIVWVAAGCPKSDEEWCNRGWGKR